MKGGTAETKPKNKECPFHGTKRNNMKVHKSWNMWQTLQIFFDNETCNTHPALCHNGKLWGGRLVSFS